MATWVALLRGINVGGKHTLPMKGLVALLDKVGLADIKTYIQSGNVVFRSAGVSAAQLADRIAGAIMQRHGFRPRVLVMDAKALEQAAASNPFPHAEADPQFLHLFFLATLPRRPNLDSLNALKAASEAFAFHRRVFYLHTPDGFGRSRLAQQAERLIGVDATARNWRTVSKVLELTRSDA